VPTPTDTPTVTPTIDNRPQGPDPAIIKLLEGRLIAGEEATYRLEVGNAGTTPTTGTLTLVDPMPLGLVLVSVSAPSGWDCSTSTAQLARCTYPHSLQPQAATHSILIVVRVVPNAPSPILNVATVSVDTIDVDPTNDTDSLSTPVLPPPAPAPALSPFALAGALLLMLFVARRRLRAFSP
jgi:uncharacterized repeat protein (TIGR01451 family)